MAQLLKIADLAVFIEYYRWYNARLPDTSEFFKDLARLTGGRGKPQFCRFTLGAVNDYPTARALSLNIAKDMSIEGQEGFLPLAYGFTAMEQQGYVVEEA